MSTAEGSGGESDRYEVILSDAARAEYSNIASKRDFAKVDKVLQLLDTVPEIGRLYDHDYPAARPPFPMRVAYAGNYGIYYVIEEDSRRVAVLFIEDQRRNPLSRFYGVFGSDDS